MGAPMALNMVKAGQDVAVWNRSPGKTDELAKAGAKVFATKKEIVDHCDILFACVTDPVAAMDLVTGDDGIAQVCLMSYFKNIKYSSVLFKRQVFRRHVNR